MNQKELAAFLKEWGQAPSKRRQELLASVEAQYRDTAGIPAGKLQKDAFVQWIAGCLRQHLRTPEAEYRWAEDVAEYLEKEQANRASPFGQLEDLPAAAYKPPSEWKRRKYTMPDDETIRLGVRKILDEMDKKAQ